MSTSPVLATLLASHFPTHMPGKAVEDGTRPRDAASILVTSKKLLVQIGPPQAIVAVWGVDHQKKIPPSASASL